MRDAVTAVQALPAQCSVPVRVAKVVSMKEQGKLFKQTTMTKMNRCISTEDLTRRLNKIAIHGAPQMAVDKDAIS